ncbi:Retrovirus-related Pol polyprotein from transposon RE1 [Senna tora]|uniref:Retrovirus-related Pol polyprotein from transposon RE1 n=1 Tax=Senna tora TaxID=362788 RepID=A0A834SGA2_9FABA|nr:Retrovirus-related Pol polyprotein from transposon RE1 [Senna tora]
MEGRRSGSMINGRISLNRRYSGRPIPRRGQVKLGIVVGLANSVASIFSRTRPSSPSASRLAR